MENNLAPQIMRDARLWTIGEGPNEPLTIQIGRKARHTCAIAEYLGARVPGAKLWAELAETLPAVAERCHSQRGPFPDRSTAQVWTDFLIGRLACEALLLAAVREAHGRAPSARLDRALCCSEERFALALRAARDGLPEHRSVPTAFDVGAAVTCYSGAIGDIEQGLAGEDEVLDPYLRKTYPSAPQVTLDHLPGELARANAEDPAAPAPEDAGRQSVAVKRTLLAQVLQRRLAESSTEIVDS
jgi:hypothetical protein